MKLVAIFGAVFVFMIFVTMTTSFTVAAQKDYIGAQESVQATGEWIRAYRDDQNFDSLGYNSIVHPTSDGGFIVASSTYPIDVPSSSNISILKLYADGGAAWRYEYGGTGTDSIVTIEEFNDGGFIVLANTESNTKILLLKLDESGSILWQKTYAYHTNNRALSLDLTQEGDIVVTANTFNGIEDDKDSWLLKLNSDGTIAWQKLYGGTLGDSLGQIQSTSDGGYLLAGSTESFAPGFQFNPALWVMKLDAIGEISWQKTYGSGGAGQLHLLANGEYIILRGNELLRLDDEGTVIWSKVYQRADSLSIWLSSVAENADGSFLLIGLLAETLNMYEPSDNIWISKIDSTGEILWQKTIGEDIATAYWATSGQGVGDSYVVSGSKSSFGPGDYELLLFKLNASGEIPDCNLCSDGNVVVESSSVTVLDADATANDVTVEPGNSYLFPQTVSTQVVTLCGEEPVVPTETAPEGITFYGPTIGQINTTYDFIAEVGPLTTSLPLNFSWQTTEQIPVDNTNGLTDTISYTWNTPGIKNIFVTVNNSAGSTTSSLSIAIGDALETVESGEESSITDEQVLINIPANAVSEATQLLYTNVTPTSTPAGFSFAGFGFTLDAYRNNIHQENFTFQEPVTVTMQYTLVDVDGLDESALKLYFWNDDENQWIDAATSCTPTSVYVRQPNQLSVKICHLSEFGLFGPEQYQIYLPMTQR